MRPDETRRSTQNSQNPQRSLANVLRGSAIPGTPWATINAELVERTEPTVNAELAEPVEKPD